MSDTPSPLTLGQILDRVYRLMRAFWRPFLGIALVPASAMGAVMAAAMAGWMSVVWTQITTHGAAPLSSLLYPGIFMWVANLLLIPLIALYLPAAIYAATQANLGVKVGFLRAYSVAWRHYGRYLWLMVLLLLYVNLPLFVIAALIGGGAFLIMHGSPPGAIPAGIFVLIPVAVLAYLGLLVYVVLIMLRFAVVYPACVVEELSARAALRRSASLTRGARGRIFLVMLIVYAVTYVACMAATLVLEFIASLGALAAFALHVTAGSAAFYILIGLAVLLYLLMIVCYAALIYAAMNTSLAVIYHDQRWRKDGLLASALPA